MANSKALFLILAICVIGFGLMAVPANGEYDSMSTLVVPQLGYEWDELEFELDSMSNRRILAQTSYISYGALNKNRVPCSRRGASYYNCQPGAQANPYRRGCSTISRCRRS
ncbi:hypothetical protein vseg_009827 [Gypsophila vaccaria]